MMTFFKLPVRVLLTASLITPITASAAPGDAAGWKVDPAKSRFGFSGTQTGAKFEGRFTKYNAAITFDPDHPETSRISVTVDLASAATGDIQRDSALPGKDWFDTPAFPQAKFETTVVHKKGANTYEATGNLTLRGVTRPVVLPFTLDINGATAHAKGHADLVRSAFGVGQGPWATGQWVALEVGIDVDLVATRSN
jgi:polyisoprenoid-binding protein YceI